MNKCLLPEKCMIFAWFMHEKNKKSQKDWNMKCGTCLYPNFSRETQKWYQKPPPWLLRAHGEHGQGHLHAPHQVGVWVYNILMWHMFLP